MRGIKRKLKYFIKVIHTFRGLSIVQWYFLIHFCDVHKNSREKTLKLRKFVTNKIIIRSNSSDVWLTANLLVGRQTPQGLRGDYDEVLDTAEKRSVCDGRISIIDAGANIGLFALLVKNRYQDSEIYLIEPDQDNYDILEKNMSGLSGIHLFKAGLWYKDAYLRIINPEAADWSKRVDESAEEGIQAITIDDIIEQYNLDDISILKMDIEGSEYYVFKYGSDNWLMKSKMYVIETHDKYVKGTDELVNKTLERYSFEKETMGENQVFFRLKQ